MQIIFFGCLESEVGVQKCLCEGECEEQFIQIRHLENVYYHSMNRKAPAQRAVCVSIRDNTDTQIPPYHSLLKRERWFSILTPFAYKQIRPHTDTIQAALCHRRIFNRLIRTLCYNDRFPVMGTTHPGAINYCRLTTTTVTLAKASYYQ